MKLTDRKKEVLQFIKQFIAENGYSPSVREICDDCHITPSTVHGHLTSLKKSGYLDWKQGQSRTIKVLGKE